MFGNDYDTVDGTGSVGGGLGGGGGDDNNTVLLMILSGVRDYIHVVDLAKGHIAALRKLKESCGCKVGSRTSRLAACVPTGYLRGVVSLQTYNLGTGKGYSVLQMVTAVEKASGRKVGGSPRYQSRAPN